MAGPIVTLTFDMDEHREDLHSAMHGKDSEMVICQFHQHLSDLMNSEDCSEEMSDVYRGLILKLNSIMVEWGIDPEDIL